VLRSLRAGCAVSAFVIAVLGPGALVAAGDDGPARTARADRPTRTVLRPTEVPELAPPVIPGLSAKQAIVLVSGINSFPQDPTFDPLISALFGDPRYDIYRFGGDPAYPYDTLGDLDVNARSLRDEVRALGATHPAVHIVAHSMGGAVADRAFSSGLSAKDGVATYVALASPHSGSSSLAASTLLLDSLGDRALEVRAVLSPTVDPGSDAARGLARARPVSPPAGVVRLDLRMSTDWGVTARDASDPGVESRTLVPSDLRGYVDGHGAVTRDAEALRLVKATIDARAIPADTRGWQVKLAAGLGSFAAEWGALFAILAGAFIAGCIGLALSCAPLLRLVTRPLAQMQLRAVRRK
jgi:hypothetical protein